MMKKVLFILISISAFLMTGCTITPKYHVTIDAITSPDSEAVQPSTYQIKALDTKKDENGLLFQKYSKNVAQALHEKGYLKSMPNQLTNQFIYFDYGMDKVNEATETYTEPDISFHIGWGYPYYHPFYHPFYGGGYTTYRKTRIYYNRYITLLAKDALDKELWRIDVSSIGESKNLQKIIPMLIDAAAPYIGTNTTEPVEIVIKEKPKKK
jgi:hypothetical protein